MAEQTAARLHAGMLRHIHEGCVWHYPAGNGSTWAQDRVDDDGRLTLIRPSYRMAVIEQRGLAEHDPTGTNGGRVPWRLTDEGRKLAEREDSDRG